MDDITDIMHDVKLSVVIRSPISYVVSEVIVIRGDSVTA